MKIRDRVRQAQSEQKGAELSSKRMGKCLHKLFKVVINKSKNSLPNLRESGSEVSHFIPEPRNFTEVTILPADIRILG